MKGYLPVVIPVKQYSKAYIENKIGTPIILDRRRKHSIIEKLVDYLEKDASPVSDKIRKQYNAEIKLWLTYKQFRKLGETLRGQNLLNFNNFVESRIKEEMRFLFDEAWKILPSFECHLPEVRESLGISIEDWPDDSIKKDYYRYRKREGLLILRKNDNLIGGAVHRKIFF